MKILTAFLLGSVTLASARFQLRSETRTNLSGGNGASILTLYHYDDNGNRILKETRPAPDTSGAANGSTQYSYDSQGRLTKFVVLDSSDTASIVEYGYGSTGNLTVIRTKDKAGEILFADTLIYNSRGLLTQNRRITAGMVLQTHNFKYDGTDRLIADTLFEDQGSGLVPAQAVLTTYDSVSRVATEAHHRNAAGAWYLINTVVMGYGSGRLNSLTNYERDGAENAMLDSIAIAYDTDGNRVEELGFDDERSPLYSIEYKWISLDPGAIKPIHQVRSIALQASDRGLRLVPATNGPVSLNLRNAQGVLVRRESFASTVAGEACEFVWPASMAKGIYVAEAVSGNARKALTVFRP